MFVGDLFEKKSEEKDLYKTTKYADTRRAIDAARKEYPGANDLEALAAHSWKQDQTNRQQQKEINQLAKDLKDKEKRFQDFTKAVAGMDLTPPEQARAAQDIEQGREPKIPEKPKAKFDPVTGTPTAMPKTSTPRAQAPSTAIPATMPTIGATAPATDKQAPAQQAQPQATTQRAQPQTTAVSATSPAIAQMARQLTPGRVIKGRGQPANQPAQQLPAGVADLSQARADRETKLAQAGLGGLATGTYGLEEQSVPTGAGNEEIAAKNEKRIVQAYLGDTSARLEFLTGLPLPLNKQQVYAFVDAFALIPNGANKDALKINLFSNRTFLIEWMFENIVNPATPTNRPTDVDQKELDQDQGQQLALEGDVIPMTGRPQVPDEVKAYQYALEILKAAFDERVPTAKVDQMKQILFHDFQARIQQAPDETYYLNRNGVKSRLPDPRTLPMEDSWHDGQSAWSSEHDQWAKESTDPVIALTGVDESSNDFMAADSASPVGGKTNENRLSVGDPIKVIGPNEFEGATGEIVAFSPISGTFVIVDLYNHGKHSMHLSDVEYNDYADRDQDDLDESESLSDIDIMRQDPEQMTDRQFLSAYGMSKIAFQQRYRTLLKPAAQQDVPVKEGWSDRDQDHYAVYIKGVKAIDKDRKGRWLTDEHARNIMYKLKAKFEREKKDPSVITIAPVDHDKGVAEGVDLTPYEAGEADGLGGEYYDNPYPEGSKSYVEFRQGWRDGRKQAEAERDIKEAGSPAQQAAIAIAMKKAGKKPKHMDEDIGSWIVYDPKTKQIKKRFKTHTAGKSYAKVHNLGFASSEYYFDNIKQPVNEFSPGGGATLPPVKPPKNDGDRWEDEDDDNNGWHPGKRTEEDLHNPLGDQIKALLKKKNTIVWYPWADQEQNTKYRTQAVIRQITGEQIVNGRHMVSFKYCWRPWYKTANGMEQGGWRCDQSHLPPDAHKWLALGPVGSKTYEIQDLSKNPDWKDPRSPEEIEWRKRLDDLDEAETDYSKRRQRERDIDAGKPVTKQRQPRMTDYQRRRAQQKKEMELGETTNYWTRLQNERSKKLNSLVNELKESIK